MSLVQSVVLHMRRNGAFTYLWRMGYRQFIKRVFRRDLGWTFPNGFSMRLPRDNHYASEIWLTRGRVDQGCEEILERLVEPGGTFYDVGAHIGYYSVRLAHHFSRIVAFEPDPRSLPVLRENLDAVPGAEVRPEAVSDSVGSAVFLQHRSSPRSHLVRHSGDDNKCKTITAATTTLDSMPIGSGRPVRAIKIDTEGHEVRVVAGSRRLIERDRPVLLIEASAASVHDLQSLLRPFDYGLFTVGNRHRSRSSALELLQIEEFQFGMLFAVPTEMAATAKAYAATTGP
jgi:FkbM family methyltransferase